MVDPVAIGFFLGKIGLAAAAQSATLLIVTSIVVNLAIANLLGKILAPRGPKTARDKGMQNIIRDNVVPRRIIYGEAVVGGPYALIETNSTRAGNNEWLQMIVVVAGHPVDDFLGVFVNEEYVNISGTSGNDLDSNYYVNTSPYGTGIAAQHLQIIKNNGWGYADNQYVLDNGAGTDAADDRSRATEIRNLLETNLTAPTLTRDSGTGLYTDTGFKLTNCAHIFIAVKYNRDVWNGFPQLKFHVKGKRLYNPEQDASLVALGADSGGTHDLSDPDTWEWSEDWTLCVLDYLINKSYGLGAKVNSSDFEEIVWKEAIESYLASSANADTGASSPYPTTNPRYTLNGVLETSSTPISNMESLLTSGAGALIYAQGAYKIRPGVYRLPDSENDIINEDMIVSALSIRTHAPRSEVFNKAAGVFMDKGYDEEAPLTKANRPRFEPSDFGIVDPLDSGGTNPYEVVDGEEIIQEFDFPFTTREYEAQRLARIQLERARQGLVINFEGNLKLLKFSVGDTVYLEILNNSKYANESFFNRLGLDDTVQPRPDTPFTAYYKQFKILEMQYTDQGTIAVSMIEESEELYDWNEGDANPTDYTPVSEIIMSDPTGEVLVPSFVVSSPYSTIEEVTATTSGTTVTTLIRWSGADAGSLIDVLDRNYISYYRLEYGIVDNPSTTPAEDRVSTWISAGNKVSDHSQVTQGPLALETLYKDGDKYDFRVQAVTYSGRASAWAYYSDDIGSDYDPSAPPATSSNVYYIKPTNGTAIHNGTGTLTVEARQIIGGVDTLIDSGNIKLFINGTTEVTVANGYTSPSDGYTGTFDSDDINGDIIVELRNGSGGTLLDTVTLVDIADGGDAFYGYIEASNGLAWVQAINGGAWNPAGATTQLDFTVVRNGVVVAQDAYLVTRDGSGLLTGSAATHSNSPGDFVTSPGDPIVINVSGSGSQAITIEFVYTNGSDGVTVAETVLTAIGGTDGNNGPAGYNNKIIQAYKRAVAEPVDNPGAITFTFSTNSVDSPGFANSWLEDIPADDGNPLWVVAASASSTTDTDSIGAGEWSSPVQLADSGADGLNNATVYLYQRTASESPIPSVPSNSITYNFSDGSIDSPGPNNNWSNVLPTAGDTYLWLTLATASSTSSSDTISTGEWANPQLMAMDGAPGADAELYYIKPLTGTAIKNGTGTLTIEAHYVVGGTDNLLTSGTIKLHDPSNNEVTTANGYVSPSDGYTGILDTGDINGSKVITLKDGISGESLDTITLVDITDGGDGIYGYIEASNGLAWTQAPNGGTWSPAATTTTLTATFVQGGTEIGTHDTVVTRSGTGILTASGGSTGDVTATITGNSSQALTVKFTYDDATDVVVVAETVITSVGADDGGTGQQGDAGLRTIQGYLYYEKTTVGAPAAPSGNTYTFATGLVTGTGINDGGTTNTWRNSPRPQDPTTDNYYYTVRYYGTEASAGSSTISVTYSNVVVHTEFSGVVRFINGTEIADDSTTFSAAADINLNTTTIDGGKITTGTITAGQIDADFYTGRGFTGGFFQTRAGQSGSPYDTEPRVMMNTDGFSIDIYDGGTEDIPIFEVNSTTGNVEVSGLASIANFDPISVGGWNEATATAIRERLGTTLPGNATGGTFTSTALPVALTAGPDTITGNTPSSGALSHKASSQVTLSLKIYDPGVQGWFASNQNFTSPQYSVQWQRKIGAGSWINYGSAQTVTGSHLNFYDSEQNEWNCNYRINAYSPPVYDTYGSAVTLYYRANVTRVTGNNFNPKVTEFTYSEAIEGDAGTTTFAGLTDTNITSPSTGAGLYWDGTDWIDFPPGATGEVLTGNGVTTAPSWQSPAGGGNVSNTGTPVNNQLAIWTGTAVIEGDPQLTFDGTTLTLFNTGVTEGIAIQHNGTDIIYNTTAALVDQVFTINGVNKFGVRDSWNTAYVPIKIAEQAAAAADSAGYGQIWVKNNVTEAELWFTTDTGDDIQITSGTSLAGGGSGVTSVAAGNGMDFTTITGIGSVTLGAPSDITDTSTSTASTTSHSHAVSHTGTGIFAMQASPTFTGTVSAPTFNATSDLHDKEEIKTYTPSDIDQLRTVSYKLKGCDEVRVGYVAQEVQKIMPDVVAQNMETERLVLDYNSVHSAKIARLEAQVEELLKRLEDK